MFVLSVKLPGFEWSKHLHHEIFLKAPHLMDKLIEILINDVLTHKVDEICIQIQLQVTAFCTIILKEESIYKN